MRAESVGSTPVLFSDGLVLINVDDVNDNKPTFSQPFYTATLLETAFKPQHVITIEVSSGHFLKILCWGEEGAVA